MISDNKYQENYYQENGQDNDRPALLYFQRLAVRYIGQGTVLDFGCGALALSAATAGIAASIGRAVPAIRAGMIRWRMGGNPLVLWFGEYR